MLSGRYGSSESRHSRKAGRETNQADFFCDAALPVRFQVAKWVLVGFSVVFMVAGATVTLAWARVAQLHLGYTVAQLQLQRQELRDVKRLLQLELAMRKRPRRLYPLLRDQFHLRLPRLDQMQRLPSRATLDSTHSLRSGKGAE